MAIALVQTGTVTTVSLGASITPTIPANATAGNTLIAVVSTQSTNNAAEIITTPGGGWVRDSNFYLNDTLNDLISMQVAVYRLDNTTAISSVAFTLRANTNGAAQLFEYSGIKTGAPALRGQQSSQGSTNRTLSVASCVSGDLGVSVFSWDFTDGILGAIANWIEDSNTKVNSAVTNQILHRLNVPTGTLTIIENGSGFAIGVDTMGALAVYIPISAGGADSPPPATALNPVARGIPPVTWPQIFTYPQNTPFLGLQWGIPDPTTAELFIRFGTDVPPPPPIVFPSFIFRVPIPEWIRPRLFREPTQDGTPLKFPALRLPVVHRPQPYKAPTLFFRAPAQAGTKLPFPTYHEPIVHRPRPFQVSPRLFREPTQDGGPLKFPTFHFGLLRQPPSVPLPQLFQLIPQVAQALLNLPVILVPYLNLPNVPLPQLFLSPSQAGDPLPILAFYPVSRTLIPFFPTPSLYLSPTQAGDPLQFPATHFTPYGQIPKVSSSYFPILIIGGDFVIPPTILPLFLVPYNLIPSTSSSRLFLSPTQAGDPLPFPAFIQTNPKLIPPSGLPKLFLTPSQAGDPLSVPALYSVPYGKVPQTPNSYFPTLTVGADQIIQIILPLLSVARAQIPDVKATYFPYLIPGTDFIAVQIFIPIISVPYGIQPTTHTTYFPILVVGTDAQIQALTAKMEPMGILRRW